MKWLQTELELPVFERGFHLITREVISSLDISEINIGLLHVS
jgi:thiamine phosphate synthase YjbQ (UPF0047 family)